MVFAGERYYNIYRIMFTLLGLWPYQKPLLLHTVLIFSGNMAFWLFQFTVFLTRTCNLKYVVKQLSFALPALVYFTLYNLFYFKTEIIKRLFEQIKVDWNMMKNINEVKILEKYAFQSLIFTLILISTAAFCLMILIIMEFAPIVLDVVAPMNESRPRKLKIDFELFLDQKQYFLVYLIYEITVIFISCFTLLATGSSLLAFLWHSCATYKISSNLMANIVSRDTLEMPTQRKIRVMCQKISRAVYIHRKSIQFYKFLIDNISRWFVVMTSIGVLSLSCNLLRFLDAAMFQGEMLDTLVCFAVVAGHFVFMFLGNLIGQLITDHSTEMFYAAYNTMWYLAPLPIQKLLLFMMQYTLKPHTIIVGGFFVISLEGFSTLVTTSMSYFTVIYSVS